MKGLKRILLVLVSCAFFSANTPICAFAQDTNGATTVPNIDDALNYICGLQDEMGAWISNNHNNTESITNILEYFSCQMENISDTQTGYLNEMIASASDYVYDRDYINVDDLSRYLLIDSLQDPFDVDDLVLAQNDDGGFGLAEGYTSDIIDTKLALKALTDLGETETMSKAAIYIASLQNSDGGFGYQSGLSSSALLTAEIADILIDTVDINPLLSYYLDGTFTALDSYLNTALPALDMLSASNLDSVYQHFHTALYRLKRDGRYEVSPYYALQAEDGGVFDDPLATALYLELLVREQNALVARIDTIAITNDKGYAVSAFNANENVNISVINEFEADKARFEMSIIKPDGTRIARCYDYGSALFASPCDFRLDTALSIITS